MLWCVCGHRCADIVGVCWGVGVVTLTVVSSVCGRRFTSGGGVSGLRLSSPRFPLAAASEGLKLTSGRAILKT